MTGIEKLERQSLGVAAGCLTVVIGGFLPWGGTGDVDRSSFEIVRVAGRNDLLPAGLAGPAKAWLLAPAVLGVVLVAAAYGRSRLAAVLGTVVAVAAVGLGLAVWGSPMAPRYGLLVTLAGVVLVGVDAIGQAVRLAANKENE